MYFFYLICTAAQLCSYFVWFFGIYQKLFLFFTNLSLWSRNFLETRRILPTVKCIPLQSLFLTFPTNIKNVVARQPTQSLAHMAPHQTNNRSIKEEKMHAPSSQYEVVFVPHSKKKKCHILLDIQIFYFWQGLHWCSIPFILPTVFQNSVGLVPNLRFPNTTLLVNLYLHSMISFNGFWDSFRRVNVSSVI